MAGKKGREFNRRQFVQSTLIAAGFSLAYPACFAGLAPDEHLRLRARLKSEGMTVGPDPLPPTRIYPPMPAAIVAAVGVNSSIEKAVRGAVLAAGGLDEIQPGQTVMIKPNMCGPAIGDKFPGRITTNPEVLRAVIRVIKERKPSKIYVGDRAMFETNLAFASSGFARVCQEEHVIGLPWTRCEYIRFYPKKRHWSNGFRMPKILKEVDHFINVPLLKNHSLAEFTCCMKAYVGVCLPLDRHQEGPDAFHTKNIGEKIAELNLAVKPTINIVDAVEIMVNGGPGGEDKKKNIWCKSNLILASKDRVACDSVALATLKRYGAENKVDLRYVKTSVWDLPAIYYGAELGLGQADPKKITIQDLKVQHFDEIKSNWT
jgi:uncharacterized protein (DUF362 family)